MATSHGHPEITGQWMQADASRNHLELAPTEKGDIFAVRDTYTPDDVLFATREQILKLAEAVNTGRMKNLIRQ